MRSYGYDHTLEDKHKKWIKKRFSGLSAELLNELYKTVVYYRNLYQNRPYSKEITSQFYLNQLLERLGEYLKKSKEILDELRIGGNYDRALDEYYYDPKVSGSELLLTLRNAEYSRSTSGTGESGIIRAVANSGSEYITANLIRAVENMLNYSEPESAHKPLHNQIINDMADFFESHVEAPVKDGKPTPRFSAFINYILASIIESENRPDNVTEPRASIDSKNSDQNRESGRNPDYKRQIRSALASRLDTDL